MLPTNKHSNALHFDAKKRSAKTNNFVQGKSLFVTEVDDYERYRSMLYALGAQSVANKMMAHVNVIVYGGSTIPAKARAKYPKGEFIAADQVPGLFHDEIESFGTYIQALEKNGFTVRNPSDEGDARFDFFDVPLVGKSLSDTLFEYLKTSSFIRNFVTKQHFPIDKREDFYVDFPVPNTGLTWYYQWRLDPWNRVTASRGEGDYPLEIKGDQLSRVAPLFWHQHAGLYFHEYPYIDSINGLFIIGGIDARTGHVNGAAISRVWT